MNTFIYISIIILILIFARIFMWPLKIIFKIILNILLGGILILLVNYMGDILNIEMIKIPFNEINAFICGILGIPGVILILLIKRFI